MGLARGPTPATNAHYTAGLLIGAIPTLVIYNVAFEEVYPPP
jgi:hypothetical protein